MKTQVCVSLVLVLFTFTEAVDPKNFKCDKNSPTGDDIFSDGNPPVNMVHIFCGQIINGKATGFHSHPGGTNPECAKAEDQDKAPLNDKDYEAYNNITVWNEKQNEWVKKGPRPTTFWPTSMSVPDVVTTIQNLYNSCKPSQRKRNIVCIDDFQLSSASEKFDIVMALKKKKIVSAYPMKRGHCNKIQRIVQSQTTMTMKTCKYRRFTDETLFLLHFF